MQIQFPFQWLALGALLLFFNANGSDTNSAGARHEISFQEFRSKLLAKAGPVLHCVSWLPFAIVNQLVRRARWPV